MGKDNELINEVKVLDDDQKIIYKSDRDHVRLRPKMYLPNIDYCFYEILDNSIDEHMGGHGNNIWVEITNEGAIRVQDEGRGLRVDPSEKDPSKSNAELALSSLKAGGKFTQNKDSAVKSGGLHGVGAAAVNFTSDQFVATIAREGKIYEIGWEKGLLTQPLHEIGTIGEEDLEHGTLIELLPDKEIWKDANLDIDAIAKRIEILSFLNSKLTINTSIDYNNKKIEKEYHNPEGLIGYVKKLNVGKEMLFDPINVSTSIHNEELGLIDIDLALTYNDKYSEDISGFTNNIPNIEGGHHLLGFKDGVHRAITAYYNDNTKGKLIDLSASDVREGLVGIVSVKISDPALMGQGKTKLDMPELRPLVREITLELLEDYLDKHPEKAKLIIAKALQAQSTREAVKRARETSRTGKNAFSAKPLKLTNCMSKNPEECEIFLVEGDSAAGTAKDARDRKTQAILPVFGKINNADGLTLANVYKSPKLKDAISAFGTDIGENFNIDNLKYHKIIIMADADDDGLHIQVLWIAFIYKFMRPIIENGYLYVSCPPLFKVIKDKKTHKYCYTVKEKNELLTQEGWEKAYPRRYKGLGEMNSEELEESTMSPESRVLIRVKIEDIETDEEMLAICTGDDPDLRRQLLSSKDICELI